MMLKKNIKHHTHQYVHSAVNKMHSTKSTIVIIIIIDIAVFFFTEILFSIDIVYFSNQIVRFGFKQTKCKGCASESVAVIQA